MTVILGGLVAEEIHSNDTSTGVSNDLEKVTSIARSMVCVYGMSEKLGTLAYGKREGQHFLGRDLMEQKDYSEDTSKKIDDEVHNFVNQSYTRAKELLTNNISKLDLIAKRLIEKEIIDIDETKEMLGLTEKKEDNPETEQGKAENT